MGSGKISYSPITTRTCACVRNKMGKLTACRLAIVLLILSLINIECTQMAESVPCTLCKVLVNAIDDALVQTDNEQEIRDMLLEQCDRLDSQLETMCIEVVGEYTDDLIEMLVEDDLAPNQVCEVIGVCTEA